LEVVTFSVHEAKTHFSKLLDLLERGEEVVILRHGKPVAQLVRPKSRKGPAFDVMKGEISWVEGWERPFTSEEAEAFWKGKW
jgi:prevent-host-death family protein